MRNIFRVGDEVHLIHVIARIQFAATYLPAVDLTPMVDRDRYDAAVREAEAFIVKRFLSRIPSDLDTTPIVHIVKVGRADPIYA